MAQIIEKFTVPLLWVLDILGLMPAPFSKPTCWTKLRQLISKVLAVFQASTLLFHCYDYLSDTIPKFTHFSSYILLIVYITEGVTLPIAIILLRKAGAPIHSLLKEISEKFSGIITKEDKRTVVIFAVTWFVACLGPGIYYFRDDLYENLESDLVQFREKYPAPIIPDNVARWLTALFDVFWTVSIFSKEAIQFLVVFVALILGIIFRRIALNVTFDPDVEVPEKVQVKQRELIVQAFEDHKFLMDKMREFDKQLNAVNFIRCMELYGLCLACGYSISQRFSEAMNARSDRMAILAGMELIQYGVLLMLHVGALVFLFEKSQMIANALDGEAGKDRDLKRYVKQIREEPVSITMGGVTFSRESAIATAGSTMGYILIFSELADSGKDFDKNEFVEKLKLFVRNSSSLYVPARGKGV
ncbi:uncharacterized protein LOC129582810 [Paramacrobiotus metropolitanus]|uniref:uncharacterized protein LOC129582810 n=1 Tax=Paramacrobiotus metropolitanus TaxID=2943436 RepID=UPI002445F914|nr:uncharacterized protein LOC129582810 [Paramacrobiotus metropolitanus]